MPSPLPPGPLLLSPGVCGWTGAAGVGSNPGPPGLDVPELSGVCGWEGEGSCDGPASEGFEVFVPPSAPVVGTIPSAAPSEGTMVSSGAVVSSGGITTPEVFLSTTGAWPL